MNAIMGNNRQGAADFKEEQVNAGTLVTTTIAEKNIFLLSFSDSSVAVHLNYYLIL